MCLLLRPKLHRRERTVALEEAEESAMFLPRFQESVQQCQPRDYR